MQALSSLSETPFPAAFHCKSSVTSLAFLSEIVQKTGTENSETMQIKRNGYGEGQKEAALSMQVEGEKKQDIEIRVSPKIYSEKKYLPEKPVPFSEK